MIMELNVHAVDGESGTADIFAYTNAFVAQPFDSASGAMETSGEKSDFVIPADFSGSREVQFQVPSWPASAIAAGIPELLGEMDELIVQMQVGLPRAPIGDPIPAFNSNSGSDTILDRDAMESWADAISEQVAVAED